MKLFEAIELCTRNGFTVSFKDRNPRVIEVKVMLGNRGVSEYTLIDKIVSEEKIGDLINQMLNYLLTIKNKKDGKSKS